MTPLPDALAIETGNRLELEIGQNAVQRRIDGIAKSERQPLETRDIDVVCRRRLALSNEDAKFALEEPKGVRADQSPPEPKKTRIAESPEEARRSTIDRNEAFRSKETHKSRPLFAPLVPLPAQQFDLL